MVVFLISFQLQFPWDVLGDNSTNTHDLMMLISFLGVSAQPFGHGIIHGRRAEARPRHMPGPDPDDMKSLCVLGQSVSYHARHEDTRALGGGWQQGQAAGAVITRPCAHPHGQQLKDQQLPGSGTQDEGCKYTSPSWGWSWPCQGGRNGWAGWSSQGCWTLQMGCHALLGALVTTGSLCLRLGASRLQGQGRTMGGFPGWRVDVQAGGSVRSRESQRAALAPEGQRGHSTAPSLFPGLPPATLLPAHAFTLHPRPALPGFPASASSTLQP